MDLIGSIKTIGDRLTGRKSSQGKNKSPPKHSSLPREKHRVTDEPSGEYANHLGQKLDVCA